MSLLLLALVAAWLAWRWRRRGRPNAKGSVRYFNAWSGRLAVTYGLPAALGLIVLGQPVATLPPSFAAAAIEAGNDGRAFPIGLLLGAMGVGCLIAAALAYWRGAGRRWFGASIGWPTTLSEYGAAVLLAVVAGVAEELFFRLLLPLLIALISGSAVAGFVASTLLFGALHRYQGPLGIVATTLAGALFAWVYLASGWLWLAMLAHALADVNALAVRPFFARLRTSAANRS